MWARLLRLFSANTGTIRLFSNPLAAISSFILVLITPYLIYVFWGGALFIVLLVIGVWLLYKLITKIVAKYQ